MTFTLNWVPQDTGAVITDPHRFEYLSSALDLACIVLSDRPTDIWVENDAGVRVADEHDIIAHCKERNLLNRG